MKIKNILSKVDHTLLSPTAKFSEIKALCDEALAFNVASVCIPPCFVKKAKEYVGSKLPICTVVGFPNGYMIKRVKLFEAEDALNNGADEIDMVINLTDLKDRRYSEIESEIRSIKQICDKNILKVIVETCLLTEEEKIMICSIVTSAGADFIKTSTGFSSQGAKMEDIILFKKHIGKNVKIKAAGGISNLDDAQKFIEVGASRLGTSKIVKIAKNCNYKLKGVIFCESIRHNCKEKR